jgi:hypothetical protein
VPRPPRLAAIALAAIATLAAPTQTLAAQSVHLEVGLVPERLGQGTTVEFAVQIDAAGGGVPSPVTRLELRYPRHIGIVTSGLGIASCTEALLEADGLEGCPSRSLMGYGTATGETELNGEILREVASTAIFMAPLAKGKINFEFYVAGESPLAEALIFPGVLLPAAPPYGGNLQITVPLLSTFPEGPDIALVKLRSTIGPLGITYYERLHGEFVPYQPSGIILPSRCPPAGFPFAVTFTFASGTQTTSRASVPCPRSRHGARAPGAAGRVSG